MARCVCEACLVGLYSGLACMWLRLNLAGAVQQYTAFLLAIVGLVQRHGLTVIWRESFMSAYYGQVCV